MNNVNAIHVKSQTVNRHIFMYGYHSLSCHSIWSTADTDLNTFTCSHFITKDSGSFHL